MLIDGVDRNACDESFKLSERAVKMDKLLRLWIESPNFYAVLVDCYQLVWVVVEKC